MKPQDLYALNPIEVGRELYGLDQLIPEVDHWHFDHNRNTRIEIRYYATEDFDGERGWELASIWFDSQPIMITQRAGRGLSDHYNRYVTDSHGYQKMVAYIMSLCDQEVVCDVVDPNEDIDRLDSFYGHCLDEFFCNDSVNPRYAVGDIVMAKVLENHLRYDSATVIARCRINRVNPRHPTKTYFATQMDRTWGTGKDRNVMVFSPGKGGIGATFSDSDITGKLSDSTGDVKQ